MGLFSKKVKKKQTQEEKHSGEDHNLMFKVGEIPKEALNIIYSEKMKQYEETKTDILHRDLCIIWKFLRADSNSEYYEFFEGKGISRKIIEQSNPIDLERMKNAILKANKALEELTQPQPSEIETKVDEIVKEKIAQDRKKIIKGQKVDWVNKLIHKEAQASVNLDNDPNMQTHSDPPKEKQIPTADVKPFVIPDDKIKPLEIENQSEEAVPIEKEISDEQKENEELKKKIAKFESKPKKTGGFFTKKVVRVKSGVPDKPLLKKNLLTTMIKKKKTGFNIEGMEEIICIDCTHYLKNHQKQGVNSGCIKCGCLVTMQEIIESHGLKKITKSDPTLEVIPTIVVPQVVPPEIARQAQQLKTLMPKDEPKNEMVKVESETVREEKVIVDNDCTCGHDKDQHYESRFCLSDCECSKFTPYDDKKN